MASFASILDRLAFARGAEKVSTRARVGEEHPFHLRPLPMEDVFFFTKRIDNSLVVRQPDPRAGRAYWRFFGVSLTASAALIAAMLPGLYGKFAGQRIESLRQENAALLREQAILDMQEAKALSPDRLRALARERSFIDPEPDKVVRLDSSSDEIVARRMPVEKIQAVN